MVTNLNNLKGFCYGCSKTQEYKKTLLFLSWISSLLLSGMLFPHSREIGLCIQKLFLTVDIIFSSETFIIGLNRKSLEYREHKYIGQNS